MSVCVCEQFWVWKYTRRSLKLICVAKNYLISTENTIEDYFTGTHKNILLYDYVWEKITRWVKVILMF